MKTLANLTFYLHGAWFLVYAVSPFFFSWRVMVVLSLSVVLPHVALGDCWLNMVERNLLKRAGIRPSAKSALSRWLTILQLPVATPTADRIAVLFIVLSPVVAYLGQ